MYGGRQVQQPTQQWLAVLDRARKEQGCQSSPLQDLHASPPASTVETTSWREPGGLGTLCEVHPDCSHMKKHTQSSFRNTVDVGASGLLLQYLVGSQVVRNCRTLVSRQGLAFRVAGARTREGFRSGFSLSVVHGGACCE